MSENRTQTKNCILFVFQVKSAGMSISTCQHSNLQGKMSCSNPAWAHSEKNLCIFHDPSKHKPEAELSDALRKKIENKENNFEGYIFNISVNFRDIVFQDFANFENCQFLGRETSFYKAVFSKGAIFNQSVFQGMKTTFARALIQGDFVLFNNVKFEAHETSFLETRFNGKHISFASAKFCGGKLDFSSADFQGTVFFTHCALESSLISFDKVRYSGPLLSFANSHFKGNEIKLTEMDLAGEQIIFSDCNFENDHVYFDLSQFKAQRILFNNAFFHSHSVSFIQCNFEFNNLSFEHASLSCIDANFSNCTFKKGSANFTSALFKAKTLKFYPLTLENSTTTFCRTEFSGDEKIIYILNPKKNDLSFQEVFFHGGRTKLKGDLHAASFIDTSLDNVDLNEAHWDTRHGRLTCRDEIDANRANSMAHFKKASDVCRSIKKCYENFGSYETAGNFYYGEMECKRKLSPKKNWGGLQFMRLATGYGEYPARVIFTSIFFIAFCSFFYLMGGVDTGTGIINRELAFDLSQLTATLMDYLHCFYFSVVSFTTLGYGDYHPVGWSRVIGASEGFFGAFFISMFVLTIGRKMNR